MENKRDERIDFVKGLLMFGVILGHMITALKYNISSTAWIHTFLRSFDMPMFAFITGIFLKKSVYRHSFKENLLNKIGLILIPTVIWSILFNFLIGDFTINFNEYWFLWSTFFQL